MRVSDLKEEAKKHGLRISVYTDTRVLRVDRGDGRLKRYPLWRGRPVVEYPIVRLCQDSSGMDHVWTTDPARKVLEELEVGAFVGEQRDIHAKFTEVLRRVRERQDAFPLDAFMSRLDAVLEELVRRLPDGLSLQSYEASLRERVVVDVIELHPHPRCIGSWRCSWSMQGRSDGLVCPEDMVTSWSYYTCADFVNQKACEQVFMDLSDALLVMSKDDSSEEQG